MPGGTGYLYAPVRVVPPVGEARTVAMIVAALPIRWEAPLRIVCRSGGPEEELMRLTLELFSRRTANLPERTEEALLAEWRREAARRANRVQIGLPMPGVTDDLEGEAELLLAEYTG